MTLSTPRLEYIAATLDHAKAELESTARLASLLGANVGPGWPPGEYDRDAQAFFRDALEQGGPVAVGWYHWYGIRKPNHGENRVLIGSAGFLGLPNENGEVEIGFSIVADWQGQGYATEMARALVDWAFTNPRVCKVLAHTTPQNAASCKVLTKVGFQQDQHSDDVENLCFVIDRKPAR